MPRWPALWAGLKTALSLLVLGAAWMFGVLVLGNGLHESYGGAVLRILGWAWIGAVLLLPWLVVQRARQPQPALPAEVVASRAMRRVLGGFVLLMFLGSCALLQGAAQCDMQGLRAPPACGLLRQ